MIVLNNGEIKGEIVNTNGRYFVTNYGRVLEKKGNEFFDITDEGTFDKEGVRWYDIKIYTDGKIANASVSILNLIGSVFFSDSNFDELTLVEGHSEKEWPFHVDNIYISNVFNTKHYYRYLESIPRDEFDGIIEKIKMVDNTNDEVAVSSLGKVFKKKSNRWVQISLMKNGQIRNNVQVRYVTGEYKTISIRKLVADAFVPKFKDSNLFLLEQDIKYPNNINNITNKRVAKKRSKMTKRTYFSSLDEIALLRDRLYTEEIRKLSYWDQEFAISSFGRLFIKRKERWLQSKQSTITINRIKDGRNERKTFSVKFLVYKTFVDPLYKGRLKILNDEVLYSSHFMNIKPVKAGRKKRFNGLTYRNEKLSDEETKKLLSSLVLIVGFQQGIIRSQIQYFIDKGLDYFDIVEVLGRLTENKKVYRNVNDYNSRFLPKRDNRHDEAIFKARTEVGRVGDPDYVKLLKEGKLFRKYYAGDLESFDEIIVSNVEIACQALKASRAFKSENCPFEDLVVVSFLGLVKAAKEFNINLGESFSTYANGYIQNEISEFAQTSVKNDSHSKIFQELMQGDYFSKLERKMNNIQSPFSDKKWGEGFGRQFLDTLFEREKSKRDLKINSYTKSEFAVDAIQH